MRSALPGARLAAHAGPLPRLPGHGCCPTLVAGVTMAVDLPGPIPLATGPTMNDPQEEKA
jgi:hypothetical protein